MILNSPYISGSLTVTGNEVITGSLTVLGGITGAITGSATSASYASNAELLDGLDSSVFVLSSSFQNYSSSNDGKVAALNTFSASILSYTSSTDARIAQLNRETASLNLATASLYSTTASLNAAVADIRNATASLYAATASIYNFTSSANLRIGSLEQYTQSLNTRSASFACVTATNNFACTQYFSNASNAVSFTSTGSLYSDGGMRLTKDLYVSGTSYFNNVTIFGTQSVNYITSSQLDISDNIITVNTATPVVRFGGLAVYDSGSTGLTGSILWDSEDNQWIYSNPSGSTYDSALFLVGPRNSGVLGNETGISCNFLSKGNGMHHMTSSAIFENGSVTCVGTGASITSAGAACFASSVTATKGTFVGTGYVLDLNRTDNTALVQLQFNSTVGSLLGTTGANNFTVYNASASPMLTLSGGIACFSNQICAQGATFTTTGNTAVTIASGATGLSRLIFQGTVGNSRGFVDYDNSTCGFIIRTNENEALRITCTGNLGLGVTPSAWDSTQTKTLELGTIGNYLSGYIGSSVIYLGTNSYLTSDGWRYARTGVTAGQVDMGGGQFRFLNAVSGTAGCAISWNPAMTITSTGIACFSSTVCAPVAIFSGCVGIGTATPYSELHTVASGGGDNMGLTIENNGSGGDRYYIWPTATINGEGAGKLIFSSFTTANILNLTNNGGVGIGTPFPSSTYGRLTVAGTGISIADDGNAKLQIGRYNASVCNAYIKMGTNACSLRFTNAADTVDVVVMEKGGNVGVGATSPSALLHLCQNTTNLNLYLQNTNSSGQIWAINSDNIGSFNIHNTSYNVMTINSAGVPIFKGTNSSTNGRIEFYSNATPTYAASIGFTNPSSGAAPDGSLQFATYAGSWAERMRITSDGRISIDQAGGNQWKLYINQQNCLGGENGIYIRSGYYPGIRLEGFAGVTGGGKLVINTFATGYGASSLNGSMLLQSDNSLQFSTGGDNVRMTMTSGGNIGIGTTVPEVSFVVKGTSIGSGGKASFYGGGDENNWSANNNEAIRIGRADILNGFYSSIWSASGSGGNELQHWLRFYISNGSNAQTLALTMFGNGNVDVAGALAKGSGSFKICHPLTSKKCTHQLVHSFIEGPQADLIYRGKINLTNGIACINIDCAARMTEGTFEALNRCVQAFTTNESSWNAVRGKVQGNVLVIESQNNTSTDEISWMVIGERQDEHMLETSWTDQEGRVITEPEII